ncbi:NAD(P)H-binding protein [Levilactobacillus namurensis]|uniref:NAD(P)H-binding protein n=1 Tax=Levilactobacillus namurensis TaxID=380393 RepID=UPI0022322B94|nr:NAD(P)H-binding protein [Levilactobacillus namurensis]MCW3779090.1 NAD(P)H-binding protein [Levilactobacillus namurensis]MDT7019926.1 NAD(P)H-binding protein [Levilactobacillus namurensis]WNN65494.1 NAD(P)H-binding protein [Levilactobacillus namurensis]
MKVLILGANGRIARLVENRVLTEDAFQDVELTLYLRNKQRLQDLAENPRVSLIEGDIEDQERLVQAMTGVDLVFVATIDNVVENVMTKTIMRAMHLAGVSRVVTSSSIGINHEGPNPVFIKWNEQMIGSQLRGMHGADQLWKQSDLDYTTARFAWLNDRDNLDYVVNHENQPFAGGSGSRKSMADVILKIIHQPKLYVRETIGVSDPSTKDATSVVY